MSLVVCAGAVRAGASSRPLSSRDLRRLVCHHAAVPQVVYVEVDAQGWLPAAAATARLAPHRPGGNLSLERAGAGAGAAWRVVCAGAAPLVELRLWFAEDVLADVQFPFLTPFNIRGKNSYVCHECGEKFEEPNPLKVHLFLSCKPYSAELFWDTFLARAERPPAPPAPPPGLGARAEALAAWWARAAPGAPGRHRCLYCGRAYSRAYGLKIHVRTHTGYKPLKCPHCARRFGDPSNLNKHVRLHASRGPGGGAGGGGAHACTHCGRGHARRRDLQRHVRAAHAGCTDATEL
ncbi:zinc finger protein 775 [Plutella xylostella]|uniref:zinc finger protein 775 n=1 Tax=Plutella xylostella TaxID=51655 RepID=UPI0020325B84|nr:zinc finger protein 775 [Plutella xylostella]